MNKNGYSILEMIVYLLISSLFSIALLMLFKQINITSNVSIRNAEIYSRVETGIIVSLKLIQNAGFGSSQESDISIYNFNNKDALFFKLRPNLDITPITYECNIIVEIIKKNGNIYEHYLDLMTSNNCGTKKISEILFWETKNIVKISTTDYNPIFNFKIDDSCSQFGISSNLNKKKINIYGNIRYSDKNVKIISRSACLQNIPVTQS